MVPNIAEFITGCVLRLLVRKTGPTFGFPFSLRFFLSYSITSAGLYYYFNNLIFNKMEEKKKSSNWVVFAFLIGVVVLMILVKLLFF